MFSESEKQLLRDTWRLVLPISDTASDLFYKKLFELKPAYRALFPDDMLGQKRKLMATLAFAVKSLDWPLESWSEDVPEANDLFLVVLALGRRHRLLYKVPEDSFPVVGEALLWTLDMGLGQAFTPSARATLAKLYSVLSSMMVMGFKMQPAEPARAA
jgi:hemoglobin-like flavoprotein